MTFLGRPIWHEPKKIISFNKDGPDTSQQFIDIYSFSHITHGILFFYFFKYLNIHLITSLYLTILFEILWEIFENTEYIIKKYRQNKEYKNYKGDSIVNIIGDTFFCIIGFYFAYKSPYYANIFLVFCEFILMKFDANFLKLSISSLIMTNNKKKID
jgi:hypothetical protein